MAYEAVPEGVEIQKLTATERDALSRYKIHENINTLFANENMPLVVGGLIASFFGAKLAADIIEDLESSVGKVSQGVKDGITGAIAKTEKELVTDPQNWLATNLAGLISLGAKIKPKFDSDIVSGAVVGAGVGVKR
jgi:hypothetical protein